MFRRSRARNSELNKSTSPKYDLIKDFMIVPDSRKFEEVPVNTESPMARTKSNMELLALQVE